MATTIGRTRATNPKELLKKILSASPLIKQIPLSV